MLLRVAKATTVIILIMMIMIITVYFWVVEWQWVIFSMTARIEKTSEESIIAKWAIFNLFCEEKKVCKSFLML